MTCQNKILDFKMPPTQIFIALGAVVGVFLLAVIVVAVFWTRHGRKRNQEDNEFIDSMPNANFISKGARVDVQTRTIGSSGGSWLNWDEDEQVKYRTYN